MSQTVLPTGSVKARTRNLKTATPSLLLELPILRQIAAKIGTYELRRRLVHMTPVCLPFLLWYIPHRDPWGPILINSVLAITVTMVTLALWRFSTIARTDHEDGLSAVFGYAIPVLLCVLLLPDRGELAMMTLGILALGDGSATLGGLWFGGRKLPWNRKKTLSGLCCFILIGTTVATIIYWGEARPGVTWTSALLVTGLATLGAGLMESLSLPGNDNFRVGSTAAVIGAIVQIAILGR